MSTTAALDAASQTIGFRKLSQIGAAAQKPRCAKCGRFVGATFAGCERDRMSARGRLLCEFCLSRAEARS